MIRFPVKPRAREPSDVSGPLSVAANSSSGYNSSSLEGLAGGQLVGANAGDQVSRRQRRARRQTAGWWRRPSAIDAASGIDDDDEQSRNDGAMRSGRTTEPLASLIDDLDDARHWDLDGQLEPLDFAEAQETRAFLAGPEQDQLVYSQASQSYQHHHYHVAPYSYLAASQRAYLSESADLADWPQQARPLEQVHHLRYQHYPSCLKMMQPQQQQQHLYSSYQQEVTHKQAAASPARGAPRALGPNQQALDSRLRPPKHLKESNINNNNNQRRQQSRGSRAHKSDKTLASKNNQQQDELGCCAGLARLLVFAANLAFWLAGVGLGAWGVLFLVEDHKYSLSQLLVFESSGSQMSLFQLLSWSFIVTGGASLLAGALGCSASLKANRWLLGLYIFLVLAVFALDLATGLLAVILQERLVAGVRLHLAGKLRSQYGVQASFTAAIDYLQTRYQCCGLDSHLDYERSVWRAQKLGGPEASVARTCCNLQNGNDDQAHVNPLPINETMCQSGDSRFNQSYRYKRGCLDELERLVRNKIWHFTLACGALAGLMLLAVLFSICLCRSIRRPSSRKSSQLETARPHGRP